MRIAIIGASGHYWAPLEAIAADPELELTGASPGPSHEGLAPPTLDGLARTFEKQGGNLRTVPDYRTLLDERPDIAVVNPWFCDTAQVTLEALARGIPVYAEKPLATTMEDLHRVEAALFGGASNQRLSLMLEIRYAPWFAAAKRAADEGLLGDIRLMTSQKSYKLSGRRPEFYYNRALYGGTIAWVGIHAFDWCLWISGKKPLWAEGAWSREGVADCGEMEVTAVAQLGLEGGTLASFQMDYLHQPSAERHDDDRLRVAGTLGTLEVRDRVAYLETQNAPMSPLPPEPALNPFADFVSSLRTGAPCRVSERDAVEATRSVLLATEAADCGVRRYAGA